MIRIFGDALQLRSLRYVRLPHFGNVRCAVALLTEVTTVGCACESPNTPLLCLQKNLQRCSNNL